ncbi:5-formyltetrahydrofolate cyclo-ligase [Sporosarcina ureilytica]|uniref:5-formyltetrahydrofolate cyclo-ligase n=2 Tax=Sporosarcina ureilytica TaxID=298596 RepID=A0A1D8JKI4_9BACL|nr:5-formyltetrahydrofolate cyclo-ligase [Sporosarcina ureilytica]
MLQKLNTMNIENHARLSREIIQHVIQLDAYKNAKTIGVTISRFPEVDTRPFIEAAWEAGKKIVVPKCIRETRAMDFRLITSFEQLETVYIDLLEPIVNETSSVRKEDIELQIVPGVVFSKDGYRIGFGGGYYDRYMADYKGETISLAFNCQTTEVVPTEHHDIPVNTIITEKKIIDCQRNRKSS